jgi:cytochrome d ubiquinol oxidase subunit II
VSVVAGLITLALVWTRLFEPARVTGALAVAAVIAAWAIARNPVLLPGLTIDQAAAPHDTLVCIVVAVIAGGVLLFPSLAVLFTVTFRGTSAAEAQSGAGPGHFPLRITPTAPRVAVVLFIVGLGMLNAADAGWCHIIGVIALFGFAIAGFAAIVPRELARDS